MIAPQIEAATKLIQDRPPIVEGQGETGGVEGTSTGKKVGCTYKEFFYGKTIEFHGTTNLVISVTWLTNPEKMFSTSKCSKGDKLNFCYKFVQKKKLTFGRI